jgi:hypothetical protein
MDKDAATTSLRRLIEARPPRRQAKPTGHMRERIAVALRGSRPNFFVHPPTDAYAIYLYDTDEMRAMYERWADEFLRHCDVLDLEVVDRGE